MDAEVIRRAIHAASPSLQWTFLFCLNIYALSRVCVCVGERYTYFEQSFYIPKYLCNI